MRYGRPVSRDAGIQGRPSESLTEDTMTFEDAIAEAQENIAKHQTTEPCVIRRLLLGLDVSQLRIESLQTSNEE